ncbi:GFA family protein [bacterium]|nr:GFA family protein [bacterium]
MSKTQVAKGSCLCGAVKFLAKTMNPDIIVCHCKMCRKWTGGLLMSVFCGTDVRFTGEENIKVFDSSQWAERGFCNNCGSGLFYRLKGNQEYHIPVSLFEHCKGVIFKEQLFIDKKPEFYSFSNDTLNMTEAEILAKYSSPTT